MKKVRVISTGEIVEIKDKYIIVKDGYLFNKNTKKEEAISGDVVIYEDRQYRVKRGYYTNFQFIPYERQDDIDAILVITAKDAHRKMIVHNSKVEYYN